MGVLYHNGKARIEHGGELKDAFHGNQERLLIATQNDHTYICATKTKQNKTKQQQKKNNNK